MPSDLFRVEVRAIGPDRIFALRGVRNISNSPAGDEYNLKVDSPYVAVGTKVLGQVRSITIVDFSGAGKIEGAEWSAVTRFLSRITDLIETGRLEGLGKTTIRFSRPPTAASMEFRDKVLNVGWTDKRGEDHLAAVDLVSHKTDSKELNVTPGVKLAKRPVLWMVDTVRLMPWVGPGPIEWAEGRFFALKDFIRRTEYGLVGEEEIESVEAETAAEATTASWNLAAGLEIGEAPKEDVWPPPKFDPPVFKRRIKGEGTWRPATPEFVKMLPGAPAAFYRSITRPDGARPYLRVELFAIDMRQLSLHMVGGHEDPRSTTGSVGTGRIPRRPEIMNRMVAAFNGAFKTEHGAYGMVVERDMLLPPQDKAATVATFDGEQTTMGSWPKKAPMPESLVSLRQNMDPLVEEGVVNPRRRYLWGFTLDEDISKMHTIRSGVCMSDKGYLVYAWGEDLTAQTLGTAMNVAGCNYGMHLDMNPFHTAFIFYKFEELKEESSRPKYESKVALPQMRYSPHRYVNGAPKDFFFLTLRDPSPGPGWSGEGLAQPAPAFVPAVFTLKTKRSSLVAIDLTRTTARLAPGEVPTYLSPMSSENGKENERDKNLLVTLSLGPWSSVRGQLINDNVVASLTNYRATLGVDDSGEIKIGPWPIVSAAGAGVRNAVQAGWFDLESQSDVQATVVGVKEKWLYIGQGATKELSHQLKEQGVDKVLYVGSGEEDTSSIVTLRGEKGMLDLQGNDVLLRDKSFTYLKIFASPRSLGAKRLESLIPSADNAENVEAKKDDRKKK